MNQSLVLTLPEPVINHLKEVAHATRQSLEQVAAQCIEGNLPPSVANAPAEIRDELLALQTLPLPRLRQIAISQLPEDQQGRHLALLEKKSDDTLTSQEERELAELRKKADQFTLRKAYAWAILRWKGVSIPALNDLPVD